MEKLANYGKEIVEKLLVEDVQEVIDKRKLRLIVKKADPGKRNRVEMRITMTPQTRAMLGSIIPVKNGSYGSPFIDLAIRVLVSLYENGEGLDEIANDMHYISKSPYLAGNLVSLRNYIVDRMKIEEVRKGKFGFEKE